MKQDEADALINESKKYLGKEFTIQVLDDKNIVKRNAKGKFIDISSFSISEDGSPPNISLSAKVQDNDGNNIYYPSLKSVINHFKNLEKSS